MLNKSFIKRCSRNTSLGTVFAETVNFTTKKLLKRPVFQSEEGNCVDFITTKRKQNSEIFLSSFKLTPKQASSKKNESYVFPKKKLDKKRKLNQNINQAIFLEQQT